jgi:nucleoside-triphosphatase
MSPALLLTGAPGSGKTTALCQALANLPLPAGGFYTQEVRVAGVRQGFELVTLDGKRGRLAQMHLPSPYRIGSYGVDLTALEEIAIPAILQARAAGQMVVVDEIGPMETFSARFCQVVEDTLRGPTKVLGTIVKRCTPFTDQMKAIRGVRLLEVTLRNRGRMPEQILNWAEAGSIPSNG